MTPTLNTSHGRQYLSHCRVLRQPLSHTGFADSLTLYWQKGPDRQAETGLPPIASVHPTSLFRDTLVCLIRRPFNGWPESPQNLGYEALTLGPRPQTGLRASVVYLYRLKAFDGALPVARLDCADCTIPRGRAIGQTRALVCRCRCISRPPSSHWPSHEI